MSETSRPESDDLTERLLQLNAGTATSRNLAEGLSVDFALLLQAALGGRAPEAEERMRRAADRGVTGRMKLAGQLLLEYAGAESLPKWQGHVSDTVRGWACTMIGQLAGMSLADRLTLIRPSADDEHFGVREWAWIAMRPYLAQDVEASIRLLVPWTADASASIRRFACESMRPRGVWCAHIDILKRQPELALPLLEPLKADPARYVQLSVGNWLNDAAKTRPDWAREVCARWQVESPCPETAKICKRGLRTLTKHKAKNEAVDKVGSLEKGEQVAALPCR